jgi:hypothetical protein
MSTSRNQVRRTSVDNSPPVDLLPGELAVEMGTPTRLWVGVPASADPAKKKLLADPKHGHVIADVTNLRSELDAIIASGGFRPHSHNTVDVLGLDNALAQKAPLVHTHAISDTTGLQTALDAKAPTAHAHAIADTTGLQTALDAKAPTAHAHAIADTTGLQVALDAKAPAVHTHPTANITGLGALATLNQVSAAQIANAAVTGPKIAFGGDTVGDLAYYDGAKWARLPAGTNGQFLQTKGNAAFPVWTAIPPSGEVFLGVYTDTAAVVAVPLTGGPFSYLKIMGSATISIASFRSLSLSLGSGGALSRAYVLASGNTNITIPFQVYITNVGLAAADKDVHVLSNPNLTSSKETTVRGVLDKLEFVSSNTTSFTFDAVVLGVR